MLDYIGQLLKEFLENLGSWIWKFFTEFFQWAFAKFVVLIQGLINNLGFNLNFSWATDAFNYVNYFFPLNETLAFASVFLALWLSILGIKIVLKLIPTVY